tara:strand:+ start:1364 stop:2302 length:939 start_codon:yes stop_codon:yes gene_type:complete
MKLLVTGGCGYVGSLLVGELLDAGHQVKSIDTQWFGNHLKEHKNLINIKKDTRDISDNDLENIDCVIHLANIANDPSVELNPSLSWEVNVLATQQLIEKSVNKKIKKFIFASSGSVYGIKDEDKVVEDLPLVPISVYNKTKMIAERTIKSYAKDIKVYSVRPATVCGWSPRMRLDVSVNMFTWQALQNNLITVFGGDQVRPNIHINDMVRVYSHILNNDIEPGFYNAGFENISILDIAKQIAKKLPDTEIKITESNDPRSYRQDSSKLLQTGFERLYSVNDAIDQIINKHEKGEIVGDDSSYTVKWMKHLNL